MTASFEERGKTHSERSEAEEAEDFETEMVLTSKLPDPVRRILIWLRGVVGAK